MRYSGLLLCLSIMMGEACAAPRIEFYAGVSAQFGIIHDSVSWGEEGYWQNKVFATYEEHLNSLYDPEKNKDVKLWRTYSPLSTQFQLCQQGLPAEIYKDHDRAEQAMLTLGAFVYRHESVLIAAECYGGYSSYSITKEMTHALFKGDVLPQLVGLPLGKNKLEGMQLSAYGGAGIHYSYLEGDIRMSQRLKITRDYSFGGLLRLGPVVKQRLFVFFCAGAERDRQQIDLVDHDPVGEDAIYGLFCLDEYQQTKPEWQKEKIIAKTPLSESLSKISERVWNTGIVGGLGAEVFVTKRLSVRCQATYVYFPDHIVSSNMGGTINYTPHYWQTNVGIFWRF